MFFYLRRLFVLTLLFCAAFSLSGQDDLLSQKQWKLQAVEGAKGAMRTGAAAAFSITKENAAGVVFFHCGGDEIEISPGKNYEVAAQFQGTGETLQVYLMLSFPGPQPRSPFPVSKIYDVSAEEQTIKFQFAALENENRLRIHFCLKGQGEARVNKISMREYQASENLFERPGFRMLLRQNLGGEGSVTESAAGYEVSMSNDSGYLALVPEKDLPIVQGAHYRVRMSLTRRSAGGRASLMLSMPGGARTPYPTVQARRKNDQRETLEYVFSAAQDEKFLRPHLVVHGPAQIILHAIELRELSQEELQKSRQQGRLRQKNFEAEEVLEHWETHAALEVLDTADCLEIISASNGGFFCSNLDWQASEIQALQIRFRAHDEGGYLRLDFSAEEKGKKYESYLGITSIPDGQWHDLIFPVADDPAWRGKINSVKLSWCAREAKIALQKVSAVAEKNLLPFAETLSFGEECALEFIRPRGKYCLSWRGAENPGVELKFFDRDWQLLSRAVLAASEESMQVQAPELTVSATARLLASSRRGYPSLLLQQLPRLDLPPAYWRGNWIWNQNGFGPENTNVWFLRELEFERVPDEALLLATGDDIIEVLVNGKSLGVGRNWVDAQRYSLTEHLQPGKNALVLRVHNVQAWGGMLCDLYVKNAEQVQYIVSDDSWRCQVGGDSMPEHFSQAVMVLGAVPVAPWGTRVNYQYVGPIGRIEVLKAGEQHFVAKILQAPAVDSDKLQFRIDSPDGTSKLLQGYIQPSTGKWLLGKEIKVSYQLPPQYEKKGDVFLATDYLKVENDQALGRLTYQTKAKTDFPQVRIEGAGSRAFFVANGKKLSPIYYDLPGTFRTEPESRDFLVRNAVRAGVDLLRFSTSFDDFWLEDGGFDFKRLERCQEVLAANAPDLFQIIIVKCVMPEWWLAKNPDHLTRYYGDKPIHQQKDRQALASKKYLRDAAVALRALLQYLRASPYADRVIAIGLSESWNSEWFWSYTDGLNQAARSGFSAADYATFRSYLREKYASDAALAQAWSELGLTFETIQMPTPEKQDAGSLLAMLQPEKDMALIDWFAFRNRAIAEAIISLGKVVKEETQGKLLTAAYYGYLVAFSNIFNRLQTVGHLGIEETARSPYVDLFWAPSYYTWRYPGMNDSPMQAAEAYSLHGKLVIVEQDMRTFGETSNYEIRNGQLSTIEQSVGAMNRAFGMALSRGLGTHWMEMYERWFREEVLLSLIREQNDCYRSLPPVQGLTPVELCIVSDQKSAFYVKHNAGDGSHRALIGELLRRGNELAVPFRHVLLADLLEENRVPAHKFYIITNLFTLSDKERKLLSNRFEREKATVLWQYAPGAFYPESGPSAESISELLGIKVSIEERLYCPQIKFVDALPSAAWRNMVNSGPWFWPKSGFDSVLGRNENDDPALVAWEKNGVRHYFNSLMHLPIPVLRHLLALSAVHIYNAEPGDPMHIGNDVVFMHAKTAGNKSVLLPTGLQLRAITGPFKGTLQSGQEWPARAGQSYGFLVEKP